MAYLTRRVYDGDVPIRLVVHEEDGDWQFTDGGPYDEGADYVAVHVVHMFDAYPRLRALSDLPPGWAAERESVDGEWRRYAWTPDWGPEER
jgi:hypothetical protein